MTFGEKIKKARKEQGLTQKELAGDRITRNMLSAIESDKASPSLDTARHIANRLSLPLSYLLSDDDIFDYNKKSNISKIKQLYNKKEFLSCIDTIKLLNNIDDELSLILAECYYAVAKDSILNGALFTGKRYVELALESCQNTVYNTSHIEAGLSIFAALASNVQAPLLELNTEEYERLYSNIADIELYKYIIQDKNFSFKNQIFLKHIQSKELIKDKKFRDALIILCEIEEKRTRDQYNAYSVFAIYTDLERCYREIGDYENAYRYANKRLSLLEAFKQ